MTKTEKLIHQHRKDEHLSIAMKQWQNLPQVTGKTGISFEDLRLIPQGLPELSVNEIDLSTTFLGENFQVPFYIEAMTGGSDRGDKINEQLAEIAKNQNLAMAVGSQSIAIKFPELAAGFKKVRQIHSKGFLFANLGAHYGLESAKRAVDMLEANALELHINLAQELTMKSSEGDRVFYWLDNINEIASKLEVPVIVKEVGFGMSQKMFELLAQTEVSAINVGGKGGTDFSNIERVRGGEFLLENYGLTTVESLLEAQISENQKPLIATGGISSAQDIVKSLILGADMVSSAGKILSVLTSSGAEATEQMLAEWKADLKFFFALQVAKNLQEIQTSKLLYSTESLNFIKHRKKGKM